MQAITVTAEGRGSKSPLYTPLGDSMEPPIHDERDSACYEPTFEDTAPTHGAPAADSTDFWSCTMMLVPKKKRAGLTSTVKAWCKQGLQFSISTRRVGVNDESVINIHYHIHT